MCDNYFFEMDGLAAQYYFTVMAERERLGLDDVPGLDSEHPLVRQFQFRHVPMADADFMANWRRVCHDLAELQVPFSQSHGIFVHRVLCDPAINRSSEARFTAALSWTVQGAANHGIAVPLPPSNFAEWSLDDMVSFIEEAALPR